MNLSAQVRPISPYSSELEDCRGRNASLNGTHVPTAFSDSKWMLYMLSEVKRLRLLACFGVEYVYWLTPAHPMNTKPTEKQFFIILCSFLNENLYQFSFLYVLLLSKDTIWHSKLNKILIDIDRGLMGFSRRRWLEPRVDGQVALAAGWPSRPNGGYSSGHTRSSRQHGLGQCLHAPVQWHWTCLETVHVGGQCWGKCVFWYQFTVSPWRALFCEIDWLSAH